MVVNIQLFDNKSTLMTDKRTNKMRKDNKNWPKRMGAEEETVNDYGDNKKNKNE